MTTADPAPCAVVGGGIAGAAACLALCKLGVRPLWIAPPAAALDKPGEHLAAAARPLLKRLGADDLLQSDAHRPAHALVSVWGSDKPIERSSMAHLEGPPMVLNRPAFEKALVERALDCGANSIPAALTSAERLGEAWQLTTGERSLRARFLLDASGRKALVAGNRAQRFRADRLAALFCFLDRDDDADVEVTRATLIESVEQGWWYAALLNDGRMALCYFSDGDLLPKAVTRQSAAFQRLLAETRFVSPWLASAGYRLGAPPQIASAATTWIAPAAGADWLALGDAAAAFDPLSSHGMTTALWTALQGAEAAVASLAGDPKPLQRYTQQLAQAIQTYLNQQALTYGREARFDSPFWGRRRRILAQSEAPQPETLGVNENRHPDDESMQQDEAGIDS